MYEIGQEEIDAVTDTLRRGILTRFQGGKEGYLAKAERLLAEKMGVKHALMVNSGTSALMCAMVALGIGKGDEVLVSAYTWISTPLAPMLLQAIPKLVEVDDSLTMDPDDLERKITPRTKAILVIHMANLPCDMDRIMAIANKHGIPVVEDACQGVGGYYKGRRLGTIGAVGCYSFNNYKNITCGEGGGIVTNDFELFDRARLWHDAGTFVQAYDAPVKIPMFAGQDYRASEIDGAILFCQLQKMDHWMDEHRKRVQFARDILIREGKYHVMRHNDPASQINMAIQFKSEDDFRKAGEGKGWRTIKENCGRHVFTNWPPLVEKRAYRDDINPFLTPEGKNARFDAEAAPRTLDVLSRTMFVGVGWQQPFDEIEKEMKEL